MKTTAKVLISLVAVYLLIFAVWILMSLACIQYEDMHGQGYCGNDYFSKVVRRTHGPIINLIK